MAIKAKKRTPKPTPKRVVDTLKPELVAYLKAEGILIDTASGPAFTATLNAAQCNLLLGLRLPGLTLYDRTNDEMRYGGGNVSGRYAPYRVEEALVTNGPVDFETAIKARKVYVLVPSKGVREFLQGSFWSLEEVTALQMAELARWPMFLNETEANAANAAAGAPVESSDDDDEDDDDN